MAGSRLEKIREQITRCHPESYRLRALSNGDARWLLARLDECAAAARLCHLLVRHNDTTATCRGCAAIAALEEKDA